MKILFVVLMVLSFLNNEALAGRRKKPKVKCGDGRLSRESSERMVTCQREGQNLFLRELRYDVTRRGDEINLNLMPGATSPTACYGCVTVKKGKDKSKRRRKTGRGRKRKTNA